MFRWQWKAGMCNYMFLQRKTQRFFSKIHKEWKFHLFPGVSSDPAPARPSLLSEGPWGQGRDKHPAAPAGTGHGSRQGCLGSFCPRKHHLQLWNSLSGGRKQVANRSKWVKCSSRCNSCESLIPMGCNKPTTASAHKMGWRIFLYKEVKLIFI